MSADSNRLLFVLSARGSLKWTKYCEAVDFLSASSGKAGRTDGLASRSGLLQCLEALGHCDVHYDQGESTINITPPAFCRLPSAGFPKAVLTGARCLQTRKQLAEAEQTSDGAVRLTIERCPGSLGLLPDTIQLSATSEAAMAAFCAGLGIRYTSTPSAWMLVNWCGTLPEYEATLDFRIPDGLNWARYDFSISHHQFVPNPSLTLPRLSRYRNPTTGLPIHVFFRDSVGAEVDLRWGRYLLLSARRLTLTAYDERRHRLCVPVRIPLPGVVARTVCLCSGKPPILYADDSLLRDYDCRDWLMFEGVPPQIAWAALSKVGQQPARVEIR